MKEILGLTVLVNFKIYKLLQVFCIVLLNLVHIWSFCMYCVVVGLNVVTQL